MPRATLLQTNFLGGEVSQFAQGRYDRPEYRTGLARCLNGIPVETGTWVRRPGFRHAGTTRSGSAGRVIKFDFQEASPCTMEFTDGHLRFWQGTELVFGAETVPVAISAANPAVMQTPPLTWADGSQVVFTNLGTSCPTLQGRVVTLGRVDSTHFSMRDAVTGLSIDGSTLGALPVNAQVSLILDVATPYLSGLWSSLRSVQSEGTAFLLQSSVAPQALTIGTPQVPFTTVSFGAATFNDGPYLDPFTNGVQAVPSALKGIVSLGLQFPAYDSGVAYAKGAFVTSSSVNYQSLVDQNVGNTPAGSPSVWLAVSAGAAIGPNGFQASDVGRLVRLFSEPPVWAVGTTYSTGQVVSYNPSNLPGQTTYWGSLVNANTGNIPGADLTHWQLLAQGGTSSPAIWTWGRITGLTNAISGGISGATNIGGLTGGGGLAAAFDGTLSKPAASCASFTTTALSIDQYVGKNYTGASPQAVLQGIYYPSNDQGFGLGAIGGHGTPNPVTAVVVNLRAKATAPVNPSDGALLGSSGVIPNSTAPVTILSADPVTTWNYVWFEIGITFTALASNAVYCGQAVFFNPAGTGTSAGVNVEILGPPLLYNAPVLTWRLGVYSNTTGWPTCGTYHSGRIWLSGVVPNRADSGVSNGNVGGTVNFAPTDQYGNVLDSSGISATFNLPDTNPIFWMAPDDQGIVCGTKAGEVLIFAPGQGAITPTNIDARRRTTVGCANVEPRRTEHTLVLVQKFGRKLMEFFADVFSGRFTAPNLSVWAKHLTVGNIQEIAYQQELAPILWARVNGGLIGCTYKRDTLMTSQGPTAYGWHRHALGSGRIVESIAVGPSVGGNVDALTIVTNDPVTNVRHVEVLTDILDEGSPLTAAAYLDDHIVPTSVAQVAATAQYPYGALTLNGLWDHNGKSVDAWVAGLDCNDQGTGTLQTFTVANGSITIPYGDSVSAGSGRGLFTAALIGQFTGLPAFVGFSFTSDGQTVRPNTPAESGAPAGPAMGKKHRIAQYGLQLEGAQGISIGGDFSHLRVADLRLPDDATPLLVNQQFTGILWDTFDSDWDFDGMMCWRVTRPHICNVTALAAFLETVEK